MGSKTFTPSPFKKSATRSEKAAGIRTFVMNSLTKKGVALTIREVLDGHRPKNFLIRAPIRGKASRAPLYAPGIKNVLRPGRLDGPTPAGKGALKRW